MQALQSLSHHELVQNTKILVNKEKQITLEILRHLREIDRRKLYLERGTSSLFEFCTKILGYDDASASRRIASMRLISELPQVEKKIEEGKLSLSTASQAAYFFKAEEKQNREKLSSETKLDVISKLENKSRRDCEKVFLELSPQNASVRPQQIKPISESKSKVTVVLDDTVLENLKRIQELASHKLKGADLAAAIAFAAEEALKKLDPERKHAIRGKQTKGEDLSLSNGFTTKENAAALQAPELEQRGNAAEGATRVGHVSVEERKKLVTSAEQRENVRSRYVPAAIKREIWVRDQGQCQFQDPLSKRKCCSRKFLHFDHVKPFGWGGETRSSNLRLLCASHNLLMARKYFGKTEKLF